MSRLSGAMAIVALTLGPWSAAPLPAAEQDPATTIRLPLSIERVWYRSNKKRAFGGAQRTGDLTITPEALELSTRKREVSIPLGSIRMVSLGKMRGDVDTDWVILELEQSGATTFAGLRDGSKFGYGKRTVEIYDTIKQALRQASAAQYDVPPGYVPYDELDRQLTLAVPQGWSSFHESIIKVDDRTIWGTVVFSSEPIGERPGAGGRTREDDRLRMLERVEAGDLPAFFVERRQAGGGMTCDGFSNKATKQALRWAVEDPLFGEDAAVPEAPQTETISMGSCEGLRVVLHGARADGSPATLDLRMISDGKTAIVLGLRARPDRAEASLEPFEQAAASLRMAH